MKRLFIIPLIVVMLISCGGLQIPDDSNSYVLAFGSGKTMAISLYMIAEDKAPELDKDLSEVWVAMMERNKGLEVIPSSEMMKLYSDSLMVLVLNGFEDKYNLLDDLRVILKIYGAQYDESGEMTSVSPVPYIVADFFEDGFESGRKAGVELIK